MTFGPRIFNKKKHYKRKSYLRNSKIILHFLQLPPDIWPLANLSIDSLTSIANKLDQIKAVHAK